MKWIQEVKNYYKNRKKILVSKEKVLVRNDHQIKYIYYILSFWLSILFYERTSITYIL